MLSMLTITGDEQYYYDAELGSRPIRFIEKYIRHHKGKFAGQLFLLTEIQRKIISDVYGWVDRVTKFRRFNQVWWEGAVGCGKSPTLAAIGIYELAAGGEPGCELYSVASNFSQARIIFDTAKRMIEASEELAEWLYVTQYEIRNEDSNGFWRIISGKGPKAGTQAHGVYADEIHEWPAASREIYDSLQGRMGKRRQPIFWSATNAGTSRQSLCWQLHDEAVAVLEGKSKNKSLYPILWMAPMDAPIDSPATWKLANPLLNVTIDEQKVREEWERAVGIPALEARFRRLYAGQWIQGSNKWLDLGQYDKAIGKFSTSDVANHALYVGIDGADGDDLFAVTSVYAGERFYIDAHFYIPEQTANKYDLKAGTSYKRWSELDHITLLDAPTISPEYKRSVIAAKIIEQHKSHPIKAVCYDRARVDDVIDELEKAGIVCLPIAQGYTVSPGCRELDRRLLEQSITFIHNPVMRMCAENVEVKSDDRGNIWPVKQNQKGQYAGVKSMKIDGIQALVTALTEARKHNYGRKSVAQAWLI